MSACGLFHKQDDDNMINVAIVEDDNEIRESLAILINKIGRAHV